MNNKEYLHNWLFTYNSYTENYRACKREDYLRFFSEPEENFIRSKSLQDLEDLIIKFKGEVSNPKEAEKFLKLYYKKDKKELANY